MSHTPHKQVQMMSDAQRLTGLISGKINFEHYVNRDHYYRRRKPEKINAVHGFLATLFYKASSGREPRRLAKALSISNLNGLVKMSYMNLHTLCAFLTHYLELDEVPENCKKQLKQHILASNIMPQNHGKSCLSICRSWGWGLCCCGSVSLPLSCYLSSFPLAGGIIATAGSLICGCCTANCCLAKENARMRLIRYCTEEHTEVTCCQSMAMKGGPDSLEKCLEFIPFKGPSFGYWKPWIQDMHSVSGMFR